MMYGDNKKREMARSILPSKRRQNAKDNLCAIRRKARRAARRDTRLISHEEDSGEFTERDLYAYPMVDIRNEVRDRRDADKLSHFQNWAIKVTDGMEPDARMAHMMKILPDNLIGWHARSHLRWRDEFELDLIRQDRVVKYRSKRSHPFQHRNLPPKPVDVRNVLPLILEGEEARDALQMYMQKKHVPCIWTLSYGVPTRERKEVFHPSRKGTYSKHFRSGGYWEVTLTVTPRVLAERSAGPSIPPFVPARPSGIEAFLEALEEAAAAPPSIVSPTGSWWAESKSVQRAYSERGAGPETCVFWVVGTAKENLKHRKNFDSHPEWLKALQDFCSAWVKFDGDLYRVVREVK